MPYWSGYSRSCSCKYFVEFSGISGSTSAPLGACRVYFSTSPRSHAARQHGTYVQCYSIPPYNLAQGRAWCTPGWDRSVLNVTFSRRYSAAPVWDECRASLLLDPQRRRPLLMWQGHSRHPWLCPCRDRRVGRLFGSIVRGALNIRIRWRPPSAHQAAAAAGRATGAPHRYHRSAPSQCSTA